LLGQTNLPLREIAAECRFADQSHFTKQFHPFTTNSSDRTFIYE
jgi:transcriptional regulator GlxA family with amidase domain